MKNGTYYLNNNGSKWVILEDGKRIKVLVYPDKYNGLETMVIRSVEYFESFGNFASACVSVKGKRIKTLSYQLIDSRLEEIRAEILAERVSQDEICTLQFLSKYIHPSDTLLLEWAGVPEDECR